MNQEFYHCSQGSQETTRNFRRLKGFFEERKKFLIKKFPINYGDLITNQEFEAVLVFKRGTRNSGLREYLLMSPAITLAASEVEAYTFEEAERQLWAGYVREKSPTIENPNYFRNANSLDKCSKHVCIGNQVLRTSADQIIVDKLHVDADHFHSEVLLSRPGVSSSGGGIACESSLPVEHGRCVSNDRTDGLCPQTFYRNIEVAEPKIVRCAPPDSVPIFETDQIENLTGLVSIPRLDCTLIAVGSDEHVESVGFVGRVEQSSPEQLLRIEGEFCGHTIGERNYAR